MRLGVMNIVKELIWLGQKLSDQMRLGKPIWKVGMQSTGAEEVSISDLASRVTENSN